MSDPAAKEPYVNCGDLCGGRSEGPSEEARMTAKDRAERALQYRASSLYTTEEMREAIQREIEGAEADLRAKLADEQKRRTALVQENQRLEKGQEGLRAKLAEAEKFLAAQAADAHAWAVKWADSEQALREEREKRDKLVEAVRSEATTFRLIAGATTVPPQKWQGEGLAASINATALGAADRLEAALAPFQPTEEKQEPHP